MTPEFSHESTWVIRIRDKNLVQDHTSNIDTYTARHVHELDDAAWVFYFHVNYEIYWNKQ